MDIAGAQDFMGCDFGETDTVPRLLPAAI